MSPPIFQLGCLCYLRPLPVAEPVEVRLLLEELEPLEELPLELLGRAVPLLLLLLLGRLTLPLELPLLAGRVELLLLLLLGRLTLPLELPLLAGRVVLLLLLLLGRLTLPLELPLLAGRVELLLLLGRLTLPLELPLLAGRAVPLLLLSLGRLTLPLELPLFVAGGLLLPLLWLPDILPALGFGLTVALGATRLLLLFSGAGGGVPSLKWLPGAPLKWLAG